MKNKCDAIIFDMDGVLVDVSRSYRLVIEMTVNYFLKKNGIKRRAAQGDIKALKELPGFNNDWDLSFVLFGLLRNGTRESDFLKIAKCVSKKSRKTKKYLEIKRVFQSFYLGEKQFLRLYRCPPPIKYLKGLINNESNLLRLNIIKRLSGKYKLGIATSRPRFEALYALKNLRIAPAYIKEDYVVVQEDVLRGKPFPDSLIEAKKRLIVQNPIYIGDTINDTIAAKKAKMPCIFIGDKKLGDFQFSNINKITEVLL